MATTMPFKGSNMLFTVPQRYEEDGTDTGMRPFYAFVSRCKTMTHTAWELSEEELEQINKSGVVMVSIMNKGGPVYPMWVGSREYVLSHTVEFGGIWPDKAAWFKPQPQPRTVDVNFDFRTWQK